MMDDLGANSIEDLISFAPNTDVFVQDIGDNGGNVNDFINNDVKYVTRGGATSVESQNFTSSNTVCQTPFDS